MAIFLPDLHSKNLKLTAGERRFGTCLLRNLEDDYHCWINVPVGPKQLRPDFVVLHPGRGILALEVKDWKLATINKIDRFAWEIHTDRGPKNETNPLEQARAYAIAIKELLERDPLLVQQEEGRYKGHLLLPWGYGVVLTNITRKQFDAAGMDAAIPGDKVICQDEIAEGVEAEALQSRLWGMFQYSFGGVLSLARIDRVRWHLFPEIRIQQGSFFEPSAEPPDTAETLSKVLPDLIKVMDLKQEKVARNIGDGHRIIHGVAGSGKTLLLAFRCLHLDQVAPAKPILVLCYNKTLAARLKEMLAERGAGDSIHIRHFHGWCKDMCDLYQLDLPQGERPVWERQVEAVIAGAESGRVPRAQYAAILIDEGHDFEPDWFKLLVQMLDPETNSLLLLYDDTQNIYGKQKKRAFTWSSVGIQATGRTTILQKNYRNTIEALTFSYQFLSSYVGDEKGTDDLPVVKPELGGRKGAVPKVRRLANAAEEYDFIAAWIEKRIACGFKAREIAVLCRFKHQIAQLGKELKKRGITTTDMFGKQDEDSAHLLTMHSSKGLEFRGVVIPDLGCMPCRDVPPDEEARLLYVALTRSTESLLVTYHRESEFTRQCAQLASAAKAELTS
jgi:hypothetical protein